MLMNSWKHIVKSLKFVELFIKAHRVRHITSKGLLFKLLAVRVPVNPCFKMISHGQIESSLTGVKKRKENQEEVCFLVSYNSLSPLDTVHVVIGVNSLDNNTMLHLWSALCCYFGEYASPRLTIIHPRPLEKPRHVVLLWTRSSHADIIKPCDLKLVLWIRETVIKMSGLWRCACWYSVNPNHPCTDESNIWIYKSKSKPGGL